MRRARDDAKRAAGLYELRQTMLRDTVIECAAIYEKAGDIKAAEAARKRATGN